MLPCYRVTVIPLTREKVVLPEDVTLLPCYRDTAHPAEKVVLPRYVYSYMVTGCW
ncbi:MAG: hypothetical protein K6B45_08245 [Bacteroidaceae bacterium]|nr:hypothetical protein [Bacteroidaceae bacterium]